MQSYETSRGPWLPDKKSLSEIQHLAIQTCVWTYGADTGNRYGNTDHLRLERLSKYRELKTLTLVRDGTLVGERMRRKCVTPVHLRQCLNDERKILQRIKVEFEDIARQDHRNYEGVKGKHYAAIAKGTVSADTPEPAMKHAITPAVRVLEYKNEGYLGENGAKGYDSEGKCMGYGGGKFVRLSTGWEWMIPEQWKNEEDGGISKERKLAMQRVGGWR